MYLVVLLLQVVGESGASSTITVIYDESIIGETITLTKGSRVQTKVATSALETIFDVSEDGQYIVTVSNSTLTETVNVSFNHDIVFTFKWRIWVDTCGLDNTDYEDLDELLVDEVALRRLCLVHASVDYMCQFNMVTEDLSTIINTDLFAKWVNNSDYALDKMYENSVIKEAMDTADKYGYGEWCLMPQVPIMTSNTPPYGELIYSNGGASTGEAPWTVFNDNWDSGWASSTSTTSSGDYVGYGFIKPVQIKKFDFRIGCDSSNQVVNTVVIQASNDKLDWDNLTSNIEITSVSYKADRVSVFIDEENSYRYYRLFKVSASASTKLRIYEIQLYDWAPKGNVPIMTSNTAPYGTVTSSSSAVANNQWYVFNGDDFAKDVNKSWASSSKSTNNWLQYKFTNPVKVIKVRITARNTKEDRTCDIQASNGDDIWVTLDTFTIAKTSSDTDVYVRTFTNDNYYLYYRIFIAGVMYVATDYRITIGELQFYGRELSSLVPKMISDNMPYGQAGTNKRDSVDAYVAFDWDTSTTFATRDYNEGDNTYVYYHFISNTKVMLASIITNQYASRLKQAAIAASDNGVTWTEVSDIQTSFSDNTKYYFPITDQANSHQYYALHIIDITERVRIQEIQFYGLDYSEKEFEEGTTKKWLYDHGVELETLNSVVTDTTTLVTEYDDSVEVQTTTTGTNRIASTYFIVNTTAYNLARCKFGDGFNAGSNNIEFAVYSVLPNYSQSNCPSYVTFANGNSNLPYNCGLDITNTNLDEGYLSVASRSSSTGYIRKARLYELWLE